MPRTAKRARRLSLVITSCKEHCPYATHFEGDWGPRALHWECRHPQVPKSNNANYIGSEEGVIAACPLPKEP